MMRDWRISADFVDLGLTFYRYSRTNDEGLAYLKEKMMRDWRIFSYLYMDVSGIHEKSAVVQHAVSFSQNKHKFFSFA